MKLQGLKKFWTKSLISLLALGVSSCVSMPNLNFCKEKSLTRARCTGTLTGQGVEINDTNLLHGKTWWQSRITNIQMPLEDFTEFKKFTLKVCEKYPKICEENNVVQLTETITKSLDEDVEPVEVIKNEEVKTETNKPEVVKPEPAVKKRISLYWENTTAPHPERIPWSDTLVAEITKNFDVLNAAKDHSRFCPKYSTLEKNLKIKGIAEMFVAMAFYESSYNPASNSVDVGNPKDLNSYSVGLYQMSGNDSSAKVFKADFEALKGPKTNIKVAVEQMKRQVSKTGLFILPNSSPSRYWAVLLDGNKYSKVNEIILRTKKYAPACN